MSSYTASPGRCTNTGRRVVLVSLYGLSYLTVICSLFSLVRQWILFTSVYFGFCGNRDRYAQCLLCLFRVIPQMQFMDKVCSHFAVQRQVPAFVWTSLLLRKGSSPWFICSCSWCSSRTRLFMSFTVPLNGWTIAATATVVISCSSSAGCPAVRVFASRCRVVLFYSWWCLRFCLGQCEADDWKIHFQYQEDVGCVCMLNFWFSSNDDICPDNYSYSRFKLKDKCRSEKWEVYLYGDMTIKVMGSRRAENCGVLRSCISWCDGKAFFGLCTQVHGQGSPAIRAGKGWRGRRELAPRCSATQLGASHERARTDSPCRQSFVPHAPQHHTHTQTQHHNTYENKKAHTTQNTPHHTTPTQHSTTDHDLANVIFNKICNNCNVCNVCNFSADLLFWN